MPSLLTRGTARTSAGDADASTPKPRQAAAPHWIDDDHGCSDPQRCMQMLEQLREAFRPLLEVTELLGGDKYVTRSVLIPAIKLLKNKMRINDCDPAFIYRFKAMMVDSIDERLSAWPHYNDYEMATCLDPRFKSLACIDKDRREHVWQELSQLALEGCPNTGPWLAMDLSMKPSLRPASIRPAATLF
ncbi:hypothetical protein HPB47_016495 [Ixodes persulcatus]|uniref:Uncharacterized protein n=1 Tax=Ixodes persulcatus TaxID=34615 RepID=A0AC60QQU4_IXOPE|nr:hypothetical protein HPB47_016495 [Ixodes persulcatus]